MGIWNPSRDIEYSIFKRRRHRTSKACYPCRRRKVKCSLGKPCDTCKHRGYPDLCDYTAQAPSDRVENRSSQSWTNSSKANSPAFDRNGGVYVNPLIPYTSKLHLGSDSLPKLLSTYQRLNPCRPQHGSTISSSNTTSNPQTIFEVLCLQDSSANFPFTNLWKPDDGPEVVYNALPEDEVVLECVITLKARYFSRI